MTDKLAEEILVNREIIYENDNQWLFNEDVIFRNFVRIFTEVMQAYHESKLRESKIVESFERENQYVTDEDIQAWALKRVIIDMQPKSRINTASENAYKRGLIEAATAMRDGKINPVSRDNDR